MAPARLGKCGHGERGRIVALAPAGAEGVVMTAEKQRIAIAEACGYKIIDSPTTAWFVRLQKPDGNPVCSVGKESRDNIWPAAIAWNWIPDYLNDLNAMHEAERHIPLSKLHDYWNLLRKIDTHPRFQGAVVSNGISATAAHRAKAFIKALGLWEET